MDTYGQSRHIHDNHKPSVAVWLVGMFLPLEYQPEYHCGEGG